MIELVSPYDSFRLGAHYEASHKPRIGGVVVIQEIFGITDHIRTMCSRFAAEGFEAIAPSVYDRVERGFHAEASNAGIMKGLAAVEATPWDQVAADVQSAINALEGPVFLTGFCYGGAATWLGACRCSGLSAASAFYGRHINALLNDSPKVPIILHYGRRDKSIPMDMVEEVQATHTEIPIYLYDTGHGFCRESSSDFHKYSCDLAFNRTVHFFKKHV